MTTRGLLCLLMVLSVGTSHAASDDSTRTKAEGAGIGCVAGAVLGSFFKDSKKGVAIGCALGAGAGYLIGNHVANKKQEYANREDYLNAVLAEAKKVTDDTRTFNANLAKEIQQLTANNKVLEKKYQQQVRNNRNNKTLIASTQRELLALQDRKNTLLAEAKEKETRVEQEISIQKEVLAKEGDTAPVTFVTTSKSRISELQREQRALQLAEAQLNMIDRRVVY